MTKAAYQRIWMIVFGFSPLLSSLALIAQEQPKETPSSLTYSNRIRLEDLPPSPVELFRELLKKDREEQERFLANRSAENRKQILAKVLEYKALKPGECDARLKATELRWHLKRLMIAPVTHRPALLAAVPEVYRKFVEDRLQLWDKLSTSAKAELQTNEAAIAYFTMPQAQKSNFLATISPERARLLSEGIQKFQSMPQEQRERILGRFSQFFEFTPEEKEKILKSLPEPERQQIEKTLKKFEQLPATERAACIRSFEKFTSITLEERHQFLKNADHWKLMTPSERQQWQDLVEGLSSLPPTPPGLELPRMPIHTLPIKTLNTANR